MPIKPVANEFSKELVIRGIKIIDIGFITVLYFTAGYVIGEWIDMYFTWLFGTNQKTKWVLMGEILLQIIFIGICSYIGRNLVELIPYPLDGIMGYNHMLVKELKSGALLTFFTVLFSFNMQDKVKKLHDLFIGAAASPPYQAFSPAESVTGFVKKQE